MTTQTDSKFELGSILLSSWGYEANISDFYRVIKLTKTMVTVEKLESEFVGQGNFYDAKRVRASNVVALEYSDDYSPVINEFGVEVSTRIKKPVILKRKIKSNGNGDYIQPRSYSYAHLWDGKDQTDYNHH